ncbi:restriction system-associated AAA family ATPase [Roseibacillus persicicus]|uniref:ABC transporter n=1 Tax=Roseibacillus persicicus TaxID=454148 RepID=A0A918TNY9_9BACT|nr:restriction system-associated AAA family ATPase [Roseibacillus persicicus]GHC56126.1 ABC transporter [Roseibacillus persicicus]
MKLLRLKLNDTFRSLTKGFEIHFLREWEFEDYDQFNPYCLAGLNGSGKSNVLEALAAIFYHIEAIHLDVKPAEFEPDPETKSKGFDSSVCTPNAFELEYLIPDDQTQKRSALNYYKAQLLAHIRIVKEKGKPPKVFHSPSFPDFSDGEELDSVQIKSYLPTFILGYSSGHNEILSLPFLKMRFIHFDEYCHHLRESTPYNGSPEGRMIYLDEQYSQAILLCHYLFPTEAIKKVFRERIKIERITQFRIIIRRCQRIEVSEQRRKTMSKAEQENSFLTHPELTSLLAKEETDSNSQLGVLEKFIKCSTTHYEDYSAHEDDDSYDLYLDYWINEATQDAFALHFGEGAAGSNESNNHANAASALNLFLAFQTLLTLNTYEIDPITKREVYESASLYVNETISTPASHERIMRFKDGSLKKTGLKEKLYIKSLSDGEYQFIHTIGLCLLFRHKPCLFLLDEPETHLNPDWRASYISTLRDAMEVNDPNHPPVMREVLLTSHSPFVISDCKQDNVLVFEKDEETGKVSYDRPKFNTFGASANKITIKVFGQGETIGDYSFAQLEKLRARLEAGESPDLLIREANKLLGDSVEKVLFVNEAANTENSK